MNDAMFLSTKVIVTLCLLLLGAFALSSPHVFKFLRHDRKQRPRGLRVRHDPKDAKFEIVAVHGLGADPEYTWTCKAESPESGGGNRVHLLDLVAKEFPNARIMNFAHSSDWLLDASKSTVQSTGVTLGEHLVSRREKESSKLPIVFIGHSFGGLVIKEALDWLSNEDRWEPNQKPYAANIIESTRGILFLGTPHRGSSLALWAYLLAIVTRVFGSETSLLLLLLKDSGQLSGIADRFQTTRDRLNNAKIISLYETKNTYFGLLPIGSIVDQESARELSSKLIPIDTDHSGLNKCHGASDQVFQEIKKAVKSMTSLPPSLSRADRWILERYANDDRLWIQRISGERLPMDSCFVNLSIVKQNFRGDQHVDHVQPPNLDLSLTKRLRQREHWGIRKLNDGGQINLPDIFNLRKFPGEIEERRPRRILIRGRPGVGKSTLCKKIIDDFLQLQRSRNSMEDGSNDLEEAPEYSYCSHFARILWVPLRDLAIRQRTSYWDWVLGMYFVPVENPEAQPMAKALEAHLRNPYIDDETLFLLDGMDEIAATLHDGSDLKASVDWLLSQRNVIVTSRPSVRFDQSRKQETFDIELETIGFHQDQVKAYVEKVAGNKADEILKFLEQRPLIQDLVQIPVQLDGLCFAWRQEEQGVGGAFTKLNGSAVPETMTDLYQVMERALWRKDAIRLGRMSQIDTPFAADIEKAMETEIMLLERLAFDGLQHSLTVFDTQFLENWYSQLPGQLAPEVEGLDGVLRSLSFLRSPDVTQHRLRRNYYFLHLTQQEYFAARHLKRQWIETTTESADAIDFLRRNKYSQQFDVVWRFLSGLLGSHDDNKCSVLGSKTNHEHNPRCLEVNLLERYFQEIRKEPLDVLGPGHQRLVMHCLHEVPLTRLPSLRDIVDKELESWLMFEYDFLESQSGHHRRSLADDMEFPEHLIEKLLPTVKDSYKVRLLRSLEYRRTTSVTIMELVTHWIGKGEPNWYLVEASLPIFEICPEPFIHEDAVYNIVNKLINTRERIAENACRLIVKWMGLPRLSRLALRNILQQYDSQNDKFRARATKIFYAVVSGTHFTDFRIEEHNPFPDLVDWIRNSGFDLLDDDFLARNMASALHIHLIKYAMHLLQSNYRHERVEARKFLEGQKGLPETIAIELTHDFMRLNLRLEGYDERWHKQKNALAILKNQTQLHEVVLGELARLLSNGLSSAKRDAGIILQHQSHLPAAVLDLLAGSLEDGDSRSQEEIGGIIQLRSNLSKTVFQSLLRNLRHENPNIQVAALRALPLKQTLPEEVLAQVEGMVAVPSSETSVAALNVLQNHQTLPRPTLDQMTTLLGNKDRNIRNHALEACKHQGLLDLPPDRLELNLNDQDPHTRKLALEVIESHHHLSDIPLCQIDRLVEDQDRSVRNLALKILSRSPDRSKWYDRVQKMLGDEDQKIRDSALSSLLGMKLSPLFLERIAQMIGDGFVWSIGQILREAEPLPQAVLQIIVGKLKDENARTREEALGVLRGVSQLPPELIEVVGRMFQDSDAQVISAVVDLLGQHANLFQIPPVWLRGKLQSDNASIRRVAVKCYLSQDNPEESLFPVILEMLKHTDDAADFGEDFIPTRGVNGHRYIRQYMRLHRTQDLERNYSSVAEFLDSFAERKAGILSHAFLDLLLQKFDDANPDVRLAACRVLSERDWSENAYHAMARKLFDQRLVRTDILVKLSRQTHLSTEVLRCISGLFKELPASFYPSLSAIVLKHPELATICVSEGAFPGFYRFLLQESFDGHLVWLHQSDDSDHSSEQSQGCYQTMGIDVKNELVKARQNILGPDLS